MGEQLPVDVRIVPRYDLAPHWYEFMFKTQDGLWEVLLVEGGRFSIEGIGATFEAIERPEPGKGNLYRLAEVAEDAPEWVKNRLVLAEKAGLLTTV